MGLLAQLGLKVPVSHGAGPSLGASAGSARGPSATAKPKAATGEMQLGGASFEKLSLGPEVEGPRIKVLWTLLEPDGKGPVSAGTSRTAARLNEVGSAVRASFTERRTLQLLWNQHYDEVRKTAERSATDLQALKKAMQAIGKKSKDRGGAHVANNVGAYIDGMDDVEDKVREIATRRKGLEVAVAAVREASAQKQAKDADREVKRIGGEIEDEKKRIEEAKARLNGLFDLALKVVNPANGWTEIALEAAGFLGKQIIDQISTSKLDVLQQQLTEAQATLVRHEDEALVARIEGAASGLERAALDLDDARKDLVRALSKLGRSQASAVEALKESPSTAVAAKMIAQRTQMLGLIARAQDSVKRYQKESQPLVTEIERVETLYRGFPSVLKEAAKTGLDLTGPWAQSLASTTKENAEALAVWKGYVKDIQQSCVAALRWLGDEGDGGPMADFNKVRNVLDTAVSGR